MSSSASRGGGSAAERTVHQDFIARIRYANTLPPPPNPPKLLEIPNTGLGSGYYTSSTFATRLAREQPLNIELDAELGMPLDLIGMPGVFDGDDSSIQSDPHPPPIHPHDRALLKPLSSLGKPRPTEAAVSFLRRTEYISSIGAKSGSGANPFLTAPKARRPEKRAASEPDAGTPAYVKRKIEQSFVAAQNAARDRYSRVRHPSKKNLRLTAAYPLLPDLGAFPDSGAYVTIKFSHNPVVAGTGVYDTRVLSGVFRPIDQTDEQRAAFEAASKAYERDPRRNPRPHNQSHYEYYLPEKKATGEGFRRAFDKPDGGGGDEDDDDDNDEKYSFSRVRAYESIEEKELSHATKYASEVLLAFTEDAAAAAPDLGGPVAGGPRAALYYPVMLRSVLRSQRQKQQPVPRDQDDENGDGTDRPVDRLMVSVQAPPEDMREHIARFRSDPLQLQETEERDAEAEEAEERRKDDDDDDGHHHNGRHADSSSPAPRRSNGSSRYRNEHGEEDDAEGEEDE